MDKIKIVRTGLRIPYDLNTWLIAESSRRGVTKNAFVLQILWERAKQEKQQENETTKKEEKYVNQRTRTDDSPPAGGFERGNPKAGG